jgi:hypothetical protein
MSLWEARLAREVEYQARIEAAFDRAESYAREGEVEQALASLSEAEDLAGGLPAEYHALRESWIELLGPLAVVTRS